MFDLNPRDVASCERLVARMAALETLMIRCRKRVEVAARFANVEPNNPEILAELESARFQLGLAEQAYQDA